MFLPLRPMLLQKKQVKGAAPLCNHSVGELRFGGFTWGWGPDWYYQGPVTGRGSISYHPIPLARPQVLLERAAFRKQSDCFSVPGVAGLSPQVPTLAHGPP